MKIKGSYPYSVDMSHFDAHGVLTPESYQKMVVATTEKDLKRLHISIPEMLEKYGVSWVLLSLSVKIIKPITELEVIISTWHTWKRGVIFRREVQICSLSGEVLAVGATFSSLIDLNKRRICLDRKVYDAIDYPEGEALFEANSKCAPTGEFDFCEEVCVRPSWIDVLGHVNNFRYAELTFDNLPKKFTENSKSLSAMETYFTGELRLGESVKIYKKEEGSVCEIKGEHSESGRLAFLCKLTYDID